MNASDDPAHGSPLARSGATPGRIAARTAGHVLSLGVVRIVSQGVSRHSCPPHRCGRGCSARRRPRNCRGSRGHVGATSVPDDRGRDPGAGPVRQGQRPARRPRHPADLRRQRRRPVPGAGLRARPGPVLRDGPAPPHHRRPAVRAGRRGRPRDRPRDPHARLAPGRRGRAADPQARDPPLPAGLRRRRQRLHQQQGEPGEDVARVRRARARRCRTTASRSGPRPTPSPGSRRWPGTCVATTTPS